MRHQRSHRYALGLLLGFVACSTSNEPIALVADGQETTLFDSTIQEAIEVNPAWNRVTSHGILINSDGVWCDLVLFDPTEGAERPEKLFYALAASSCAFGRAQNSARAIFHNADSLDDTNGIHIESAVAGMTKINGPQDTFDLALISLTQPVETKFLTQNAGPIIRTTTTWPKAGQQVFMSVINRWGTGAQRLPRKHILGFLWPKFDGDPISPLGIPYYDYQYAYMTTEIDSRWPNASSIFSLGLMYYLSDDETTGMMFARGYANENDPNFTAFALSTKTMSATNPMEQITLQKRILQAVAYYDGLRS